MAQPDRKKSSYTQELERRSSDSLRVFNPLDERYVVKYDKKDGVKLFAIEAKSEAVFIRYIAEKYIREMYDKIIITEADDAVRKENERRIKNGMAEMDKTLKTNEQMVFESKFYVGNDTRAKEIIALLYMGVEAEWGVDRSPQAEAQSVDDRPSFDRALETVQEEKASGVKTTPVTNLLKCNHPECNFEAASKAGLMSHKRSHRKESLEAKKEEAVAQVSK